VFPWLVELAMPGRRRTGAASKHRLVGTLLGAVFGGLVARYLEPHIITFGAAIFVLGLTCGAAHLEQAAYRFAGITFAIITLVTRGEAAWRVGLHRCVEVSLGIAVGLAVSAAWPGERQTRAASDGEEAGARPAPRE
jgi:uncharacterized membrane protein YccC